MKKLLAFLALAFASYLFSPLSASPTSDFSLDPTLSNLIWNSGIFYTKTGALSLSGTVSPNVQMIEFSGVTSTGGTAYKTGGSLVEINAFFSLPASLADGTYSVSGFDGSGTLLGSEQLMVDATPPKAQSITYFDDNHNGKIDRLVMAMNEDISGNVPLPYSGSLTLSTRKNGLFSYTISSSESSDFIRSVSLSGREITVGILEGDMIKNNLVINTNPGSSASDLKFWVYTNANIADLAGNVFSLALSKFPNSSTGIINGTTPIDHLDTGFLNGAYFSGALAVNKIDSRASSGSLILSGVTLSLSSDSFLGDGNALKIGSGSRVEGNMILALGSGSSIQDGNGNILYANSGYAPYFTTLSGALIASGATLSESGMLFNQSGLVGSVLSFEVSYETATWSEPMYSGSLTGTSMILPFYHAFSSGSFRVKIWKEADMNDLLLPGVKILLDDRVLARIDILADIVSSGSIMDITDSSATLSGVVLSPVGGVGKVYYGTGDLSESGSIENGNFSFSGLIGNATYLYRLGFTPFPLWNEIYSATGSFQTPKSAPDVVFAFQQWSYVTTSDVSLSEYTCDTTHTDCKINFDLSPSFTGGFLESEYSCSSSFSWVGLTETGKCNPSSVTFPRGQDYMIRFQITKKSDPTKFSERTIVLHSPSIPTIPVSYWGGGGYIAPVASLSQGISIAEPSIRIQSGLDSTNRCLKSDCTVNFEYKVLWPKEACHWDFLGGAYSSGTENKCNPGYVHYPFGEFTITLRVFEQGNILNYQEKILRISNGTPTEIQVAKTSPSNHTSVAHIKLQGTLGKTKAQQGNTVRCFGVDACSINLSGEESYDLDRDALTYYWSFWNGVTSDKENPPAVKYGVGEYTVVLRVTDTKGSSSEATFHVSVSPNGTKDTVSIKSLDPNVSSLKITGVSPNPLGNDGVSEWVEITNPLGVDVSLARCALDDTPEKGSNPYSFPDTAIIRSYSSKRFYKLQTSINFNNTGDSANLSCGGNIVSTLVWDYSVPEGFVVSAKGWPYSGKVRTKVLRVVDGDTIEVELYGKQEKVRLIGVDTPETVDPRKAVQFYGKEASNYVRSMLEGREVELEFDFNPRDKYDRLLAYVWIEGKNFDAELIRLGYARSYLRFPFRYFKEFEKIGKEAMKNKIGLWADAEVKKLLDADAKEDKKALEKQLQEEDETILDDLIEVAEEEDVDMQKIESELFDSLFIFDEEQKSGTQKHTTIQKKSEDMKIEDIHISLQGALSKNRMLSGTTFTCRTKVTCSVNFTAGKTRKDTVYLWDFGNDDLFYGANPLARTFSIWKHQVTLKIFDIETGNLREEYFSVIVQKIVTVKKPKPPKKEIVRLEKPLLVRWGDMIAPQTEKIRSLSPLESSTFAGILILMLFGGVHVIMKRKRIGI